jgi:hypothetical protein
VAGVAYTGAARLAQVDAVNGREVALWVGVIMMFLAITLAIGGLRGLPLMACAAIGAALALSAGVDAIRARRLAARHHLAVLVVGEAVEAGAQVVSVDALAVALQDEWLTNLVLVVQREQRVLWQGRMDRGECSER